jgi:TolB protein
MAAPFSGSEPHRPGVGRRIRMSRLVRLALAVVVWASILLSVAPARATFPGRDGRIAYRRSLDDGASAIFTVSAHGTRERQLTHPRHGNWTTTPNWSPNGRWIVYSVFRNGDIENSRIAKMHADGSHLVRLGESCVAPCDSDTFPAWSPDGQRIAFGRSFADETGHGTMAAIMTMDAEGTDLVQVTQQGDDPAVQQRYADADPSWSPDGRRLAFQRVRGGTDRHAIFTVRLDGSDLHRLTPWRMDAASPDWSPDGRWIAFRTHETSDTRGDVGLARPSGRGLHIITNHVGKWGLLSFSPSGTRIVAGWNAGGDLQNFYLIRLDGSIVRPLLAESVEIGSIAAPAWGPRRRSDMRSSGFPEVRLRG